MYMCACMNSHFYRQMANFHAYIFLWMLLKLPLTVKVKFQ